MIVGASEIGWLAGLNWSLVCKTIILKKQYCCCFIIVLGIVKYGTSRGNFLMKDSENVGGNLGV